MAYLKITLFHTSGVGLRAADVFRWQIERGNRFLRPYGIQFHREPQTHSYELDWSLPISGDGKSGQGLKERLALRAMAEPVCARDRLPVILCAIGGDGGGEAPGSIGQKLAYAPWVIMDPFTINKDGLTLTHEAGHCAGLKHPGTAPFGEPRLVSAGAAVTDNFMAYGTFDMEKQTHGPRSLCETWQIIALRTAYFYSG
jgi:hypothetical protein